MYTKIVVAYSTRVLIVAVCECPYLGTVKPLN